jgi:outer membrane protein assembly factor BamB
MPGNGKVFISHTPEDASRCMPLFAALDAWEVDYWSGVATLDPTQQLTPAVQREIVGRDIFIRVCTPAAQRSIPMNLQVSAFRALQAADRRGSRGNRHALINLILDPGYVREPFDNATIFIDATNRPRADWLAELGRALGVTLIRGRLSRRALLGLGAAAATTVAALAATGAFLVDSQARSQHLAVRPGATAWQKDAGLKAPPVPALTDDTVYTFSDTGLYAFHLADGHQLWHADLKPTRTYGPPQVNGNTLYLGFDDGVYALNAAGGAKRWSMQLESGDIAAGPVYQDGTLYLLSTNGGLAAWSASDGKQRWTQPTANVPDSLYNYVSGPAADAGSVYMGSVDHYVYAFTPSDGSTHWKYLTRGPIRSTPAAVNGVVYVGSLDGYVYALKATDGTLVWRFQTGGPVYSSPAVVGDVVFIGSRDQYLYALDASNGSLFWRSPAGDIDSLGFLKASNVDGAPAVDSGVVAVTAEQTIYAFNVRDGTRRWRLTPGTSDSQEVTDVAVANGLVCFGVRSSHSVFVLGA